MRTWYQFIASLINSYLNKLIELTISTCYIIIFPNHIAFNSVISSLSFMVISLQVSVWV